MSARLDADVNEEIDRFARMIAREAAQSVRVQYGGNTGGSQLFQKVIMSVCVSVAVAGIAGVIGMYGRLAAIEAKVDGLQHLVENKIYGAAVK